MTDKKQEYYKGQIFAVLTYLDTIITSDWSCHDTEFKKATSINRLAEIANMSKRNLQIMFQAYLHESIGSYKNRLRLEYAQQLFKDNHLTISEISDTIGFANQPAFNNTFKKHYGITPAQKRKMLLEKQFEHFSSSHTPTYRKENLKEIQVIYLPFIGNYEQTTTSQFEEYSWNRLEDFALKYDLITHNTEYWGIAFDDTDITEDNKCRFYAALTITSLNNIRLPITNEIKTMTLPVGEYAVFTYQGDYNNLNHFYDAVLQSVDFKIGNTPILEKYLNSPTPSQKEEPRIEIWFPVESNSNH